MVKKLLELRDDYKHTKVSVILDKLNNISADCSIVLSQTDNFKTALSEIDNILSPIGNKEFSSIPEKHQLKLILLVLLADINNSDVFVNNNKLSGWDAIANFVLLHDITTNKNVDEHNFLSCWFEYIKA